MKRVGKPAAATLCPDLHGSLAGMPPEDQSRNPRLSSRRSVASSSQSRQRDTTGTRGGSDPGGAARDGSRRSLSAASERRRNANAVTGNGARNAGAAGTSRHSGDPGRRPPLRSGYRGTGRSAAPGGQITRRRLATVLAVVALAVALVIAGGYLYGLYRFRQIHRLSVGALVPTPSGGPVNILLVGNSCRTCLNGLQTGAFGTAAQAGNGGGSDVVMVLHLDPSKRSATIVSLPRDTFIPIPGTGKLNRINTAFDTGSARLVQAVEQDFGIPINHFAELNFDSFQKVVNNLGGVNMYFPDPVRDRYSGLNVPNAGCHHLNGFQALSVVRSRHLYYFANGQWNYDGLSDISRIARDHEFLRVVASSIKAKALNPVKLDSILSSILPSLQMDSSFGYNEILHLALTFRNINPGKIPSVTFPVYLGNQSMIYNGVDYGSVVLPLQPTGNATLRSTLGLPNPTIRRGTTVQVLNGSGISGQAGQVSSQISALGEHVTSVGNSSITSSPAETVIYYAPGHQYAAIALENQLSGTVIMGQSSHLPAGTDLRLVTGTYLSVASAPSQTTTAPANSSSSSGAQGAPSGAGGSAAGGAATSSLPGPLSLGAVAPTSPLPPWDPRACPAGVPVTPIS